MCEAHIRRRLSHIRASYAQLQEAALGASDDAMWLKEAQDTLDRTTQSLPGWTPLRRIATSLFSFGVGLIVAGFGADSAVHLVLDAARSVADAGFWEIVIPTVVVLFVVSRPLLWFSRAFTAKRDLFFADWWINDFGLGPRPMRPSDEIWYREEPPARNVYALEDDVYRELRRAKPREAPIDRIIIVPMLILFGMIAIAIATAASFHWVGRVAMALGGSIFGALGLVGLSPRWRRVWR